jgi:fatty acid-binding protein DegV
VTSGIGIAGVDGSRPRPSPRTVAGLERLLRSGRAAPVAGSFGPKLNIEPIITISCRGHDRSGFARHRRAAARAIIRVVAAHTGIGASGLCCQVADGTNAGRVRYD